MRKRKTDMNVFASELTTEESGKVQVTNGSTKEILRRTREKVLREQGVDIYALCRGQAWELRNGTNETIGLVLPIRR